MKPYLPLVLLLLGCAQKPLTTPSSMGTSSAIGRTAMSVEDAKRFNDVAIVHNANARTRVKRIEAKAGIIERFWGK